MLNCVSNVSCYYTYKIQCLCVYDIVKKQFCDILAIIYAIQLSTINKVHSTVDGFFEMALMAKWLEQASR